MQYGNLLDLAQSLACHDLWPNPFPTQDRNLQQVYSGASELSRRAIASRQRSIANGYCEKIATNLSLRWSEICILSHAWKLKPQHNILLLNAHRY